MSYHPDDTICAIATAQGGAARGMLRVSGPDAIEIVGRIFCSADGTKIEAIRRPTAIAGRATVALHDGHPQEIPCDAFLWPTARSYTREPAAELHTLGSPPLLESLVAALCRAGARLAEPGEFTLRAFLAGRIDLTQAEAVLGVIDARGQEELTTSLTQLAGGLARPLKQLRDDLLQLLAELEAGLDFIEEEIEFVSKETLLTRLESASRLLADVAQQMTSRGTAAAAMQVALIGAPNAGKSSLFNAMVARFGRVGESTEIRPSPAIVSAQRGTTRDYLTAMIEIDGAQCELLDTAGVDVDSLPLPLGEGRVAWNSPWRGDGLKCTTSPLPTLPPGATGLGIERDAQSLAAQRHAAAAICVCCIDATGLSRDAIELPSLATDVRKCDIVALTKCDLISASRRKLATPNNVAIIATSSRTGEGRDELCGHIRALLRTEAASQQGQTIASTAERCRESIRLADTAISSATEIIGHESGDELAAADLRIALSELGRVVGAVYTDDLLDRIFSTFCIGK